MLTAPHKLQNFAVIIRAMGGNSAADQRAALNELFRRGLWLGEGQDSAAIVSAGLQVPESRDERRKVLASLGYCRAPAPLEAREALPVIFRIEPGVKASVRRGEGCHYVTAVFPTLPGDSSPNSVTVYAHLGQHGAAGFGWYRETKKATPEEYADLLRELRGIYERDDDPDAVRLVVCQRWTRHHDAERRTQLPPRARGARQA